MKYVTYNIRGMVTEAMIPAITASCESIPAVQSVRITLAEDSAELILATETLPDSELERTLSHIMSAKGLEICLPSQSVAEADPSTAPPNAPEGIQRRHRMRRPRRAAT